jgi:hypothetical protein
VRIITVQYFLFAFHWQQKYILTKKDTVYSVSFFVVEFF